MTFSAVDSAAASASSTLFFHTLCASLTAIGLAMLFGSQKPITFGSFLMAWTVAAAVAACLDAPNAAQFVNVPVIDWDKLISIGKGVFELVQKATGWIVPHQPS